MINCYKDIIYIEYYLLEIYNILNEWTITIVDYHQREL